MNKKHVKCVLILFVSFLLFGCVNASSVIDDNEPVRDPAESVSDTAFVDTNDQDQDEDAVTVTDQGEEQAEEKDEGSSEISTPEEPGKKSDGKDSGKKDEHDDDSGGGCVLTKVWVVDEPAETIQRYVVDQQEIGHSEQIWHDPVTHQEDVYEKVKKFSFELDDGYKVSYLLSELKDMGYDTGGDYFDYLCHERNIGGHYWYDWVKIKTGTKTVVDKEGYYEEIWIIDQEEKGHYETVVIREEKGHWEYRGC